MTRLANKVALVTGGASGIGRGICIRFAEEGACLVVVDTDAAGARETAAESRRFEGCAALEVEADVSSKADCERMVRQAVERFGRLDVLVANAGIARGGTVLEMAEQDWDDLMAVNLKGVFLSCQAAAKQMVKQGQGGKIVLMSSVASERAMPGMLAYAAAKAGVRQMARVRAVELIPHRINVNAIGPGVVETPLAQPLVDLMRASGSSGSPWGRFGTTVDVANTAVFLASDEADFITGTIIFVDGGALAGLPGTPVRLS